jgi:hypothetical protein
MCPSRLAVGLTMVLSLSALDSWSSLVIKPALCGFLKRMDDTTSKPVGWIV